jgi:hypothetical protein
MAVKRNQIIVRRARKCVAWAVVLCCVSAVSAIASMTHETLAMNVVFGVSLAGAAILLGIGSLVESLYR